MVDPAESRCNGPRKKARTPDGPVVLDVGSPGRVHNTHADLFAEERKVRYVMALRKKQEKELEKARLRQKLQDNKAVRHCRHSFLISLELEELDGVTRGDCCLGVHKSSSGSQKMAAVELQIMCLGSELMKASFDADATLKEVRAYVESQLQWSPVVLEAHNDHCGMGTSVLPTRESSSGLSYNRRAERDLLQAAWENFEAQSNRILWSSKRLCKGPDLANIDCQPRGSMYFLIPFPRKECFSESSLDLTLREAQLVPRGTLVVQFHSSRTSPFISKPLKMDLTCHSDQQTNFEAKAVRANEDDRSDGNESPTVRGLIHGCVVDENSEAESDKIKIVAKLAPCGLPSDITSHSVRSLEVEGEHVRRRELALQVAARRMTEAAKMFRAGLPPLDGEAGGGFHFPSGLDNPSVALKPRSRSTRFVSQMDKETENIRFHVSKSAGADAELLVASCPSLTAQSHQPVIGSTCKGLAKGRLIGAEVLASPRSCDSIFSGLCLRSHCKTPQSTSDNNSRCILLELAEQSNGKGAAKGGSEIAATVTIQKARLEQASDGDVINKRKASMENPDFLHLAGPDQ